jgi:hypothetical protein
MNKTFAVIIGIALTIILTYAAVEIILTPIIKQTGRSPESFMDYSFLVIYPVSIFIGSVLTGYLAGKLIEKKILKYLQILPGLYGSIPLAIIGIIYVEVLSVPLILINIMFSLIGLLTGIRIKSKRLNSKT